MIQIRTNWTNVTIKRNGVSLYVWLKGCDIEGAKRKWWRLEDGRKSRNTEDVLVAESVVVEELHKERPTKPLLFE